MRWFSPVPMALTVLGVLTASALVISCSRPVPSSSETAHTLKPVQVALPKNTPAHQAVTPLAPSAKDIGVDLEDLNLILVQGQQRADRFLSSGLDGLRSRLIAPPHVLRSSHRSHWRKKMLDADEQANSITVSSGVQINVVRQWGQQWQDVCEQPGPKQVKPCDQFQKNWRRWNRSQKAIWAVLVGPVARWREDALSRLHARHLIPAGPRNYYHSKRHCLDHDFKHPGSNTVI